MVKMNLPNSDTQVASFGQVAASRIGAYESAMQALGSFVGAEGLSGQAYDNAKDYVASTLLPLLKVAILYEESLSEAVKRLPSDYRATEYLEGKSLDSEDLEAELARLESVGMRLERSIDRALEMARDYPDYEWHAHSMMRQLNQVIDRKNKVRRQLQALYAFDGRSSGFFSGIGDLETQLSQGIVQVGSDMSNFSGSFPSGLSPVWVSKVNQKWNDRVKRMRDTSSPADFRKLEEREADYELVNVKFQSVFEKAQKGFSLIDEDIQAVEKYLEKYPQAKIPEHLQDAIIRFEKQKENQMTVEEKIEDATHGAVTDVSLGGLSYLLTKENGMASKIGYSLGTIFDDAAGPIARSANDAIRASYTGAINTVGDAIGSTVFGATIGSVIGMAQGDSPGQAIASSVMTTTFSYGLTQVAMLGAAAFLGATPVGWAAIGIGVAAGAVTSLLYNSDFMGMKSVAQDWGENMDETFSNIGTAFKNVGDFLWGG
ncbi:TPA: hypothetical protein T0G97_002174 [Streptococcus suis]|nr:hypothetical protein [Streptococcus suis]